MKDYEKIAIGIGIAALGFAGYQAYKTKQAADVTQATDPTRNPVTTAIELSKDMVGTTVNWFESKFDYATGRTKGKPKDIITYIWAIPSNAMYEMGKVKDLGFEAAESGTKYLWGIGAGAASSGKEKVETLTNKPFTLMGSAPQWVYDSARNLPNSGRTIYNALTGVGSHLEKKAETVSTGFKGLFNRITRRK